MITRFKLPIVFFVIFCVFAVSFYYIRSIFDTSPPQVAISGIEENGCYSGDIACTVKGKDNYKVKDISIFLDDKPLINDYVINRKSFEYPFVINASTLTSGKHVLKIITHDGSSKQNQNIQEFIFNVDNIPLQASFVGLDNDFKVFQGRTLHVQFQVNKEVKDAYIEALSDHFVCFPESVGSRVYECFIPIKCEENPHEYLMQVVIKDRVGGQAVLENKFHIVMYPFKKQLLAVKSEKVKEAAERGLPEAQLEAAMQEVTAKSIPKKLWQGTFDMPIESRGISTDFGTVRTTQERGKYRHAALDLLGVPRSVVWACQDGVVVIKECYAHSGNTIVLDHGHGILSLYFHLDNFADIKVGDHIKKGKPVGTLGKTGYASGYHLHWELRVKNIQVDPAQWTHHGF